VYVYQFFNTARNVEILSAIEKCQTFSLKSRDEKLHSNENAYRKSILEIDISLFLFTLPQLPIWPRKANGIS